MFRKCLLEVIMTRVVRDSLYCYECESLCTLSHMVNQHHKITVELCYGLKGIVQSFVIVDSNCYVFFWPNTFSKMSHVKCMNIIMCKCDRTQLLIRRAMT